LLGLYYLRWLSTTRSIVERILHLLLILHNRFLLKCSKLLVWPILIKKRKVPLKIVINDWWLRITKRLLPLIRTYPLLFLRFLRSKHANEGITLLGTMFDKLLHVDWLCEDSRIVELLDFCALASIWLMQSDVSGHWLSEFSIINIIIIIFVIFLVVYFFGDLFCSTHF